MKVNRMCLCPSTKSHKERKFVSRATVNYKGLKTKLSLSSFKINLNYNFNAKFDHKLFTLSSVHAHPL